MEEKILTKILKRLDDFSEDLRDVKADMREMKQEMRETKEEMRQMKKKNQKETISPEIPSLDFCL